MATICPTITSNSLQYESIILDYSKFATRLHIELSDGIFSPNKTIAIDEIYWPYNIAVDLHLMYKDPSMFIDQVITLAPQLVIVHPDSNFNIEDFSRKMKSNGIRLGLALMPTVEVEQITRYKDLIDHVLVFSGNLGYYGGEANMNLLSRVAEIKSSLSGVEISWDGGINSNNVAKIAESGVDVLNVGGFIAGAKNSQEAFSELKELIS